MSRAPLDVLIRRVDPDVPLPGYAHPGDAGADLRTTESRELKPGERAVLPTGVSIALPEGYAAFVHPRSGLAARLGVADQVTPAVVDVGELPFDDGSFDLVVSFTGLHCFPDPHRAIGEMVRVLAPGGAITGSSLFTDTGPRYEPLRRVGTRAGILGPMCTSAEARAWLREAGCDHVDLTLHGGLGYFRATKKERT